MPIGLVWFVWPFICDVMGHAESYRNCAVTWDTVTGIIWDGLENMISEVE